MWLAGWFCHSHSSLTMCPAQPAATLCSSLTPTGLLSPPVGVSFVTSGSILCSGKENIFAQSELEGAKSSSFRTASFLVLCHTALRSCWLQLSDMGESCPGKLGSEVWPVVVVGSPGQGRQAPDNQQCLRPARVPQETFPWSHTHPGRLSCPVVSMSW